MYARSVRARQRRQGGPCFDGMGEYIWGHLFSTFGSAPREAGHTSYPGGAAPGETMHATTPPDHTPPSTAGLTTPDNHNEGEQAGSLRGVAPPFGAGGSRPPPTSPPRFCQNEKCRAYGQEFVDRGYGYPVCPSVPQKEADA